MNIFSRKNRINKNKNKRNDANANVNRIETKTESYRNTFGVYCFCVKNKIRFIWNHNRRYICDQQHIFNIVIVIISTMLPIYKKLSNYCISRTLFPSDVLRFQKKRIFSKLLNWLIEIDFFFFFRDFFFEAGSKPFQTLRTDWITCRIVEKWWWCIKIKKNIPSIQANRSIVELVLLLSIIIVHWINAKPTK